MAVLLSLCLATANAFGGRGSEGVDRYGGYEGLRVPGGATGFFRLEKVGLRWVFVTPEGNAFWLRGVYGVDWGGREHRTVASAKYPQGETWTQAVRRLKGWGFNALGEYANLGALPVAAYGGRPNPEKMPFIWIANGTRYGMRNPEHPHKNLYAGVDRSQNPTVHLGIFPDVFDPNFDRNVADFASDLYGNPAWGSVFAGQLATTPWLIGVTTDDADYTTGFGPGPEGAPSQGKIHPHLGWVVAVTAPSQPKGGADGKTVTYTDTKVYAKYAWRDFLAAKYGSLDALNRAWGATYTTLDTDGGWPRGRGLLDESGKGPWLGGDGNRLTTAAPAVRADLDEFLGRLAERYFSIYAAKLRQYLPRHLVFSPASMQAGTRRPILEAAGRHLDAIQVSGVPGGPSYPLYRRAYEIAGKPLFVWTTFTAQADANLLAPDLSGWGPAYNKRTQGDRGEAYAAELGTLLNLRSSSGDLFVVGIDWWAWVDTVVGGENMNFGLVTVRDNAYDGREAVTPIGADPWGYRYGAESRNYGDFLRHAVAAHSAIRRTLASTLTSGPPKP
jgi:agarase